MYQELYNYMISPNVVGLVK